MIYASGCAFRFAAMSIVVAFMSFASSSIAASQPAPAPTAPPPLTAEQLDQLVAPIALYPDPMLAQILMAATYPREIVEADRWLQLGGHAALKGDALAAALQQQPWDPSIQSLVPFPEVLHMMHTNLDWTEQLGDAFLAQEADVMDAVQRLRQRAQAAGSLASTPQQTVATEDQEIMIEPGNPDIVYVPAYNPWCIYGPWPYPDYPPVYFGTWGGTCVPADNFIAFGVGIFPAFGYWAWGHFEWRRHYIRIDEQRFRQFRAGGQVPPGGIWVHDPAHRHGVPYRNAETAARFRGPTGAAPRTLPSVVRGFAPAPVIVAPERPAPPAGLRPPPGGRPPAGLGPPPRALPPAFESFGRGADVRGEAARGFSSRMAPAPSFHAAPMPSFHGGGGFGGRR